MGEIKSWEQQIKESKYSETLQQLDDPSCRPSPNRQDWKCMACGKTENLWFNLSDGYIGCGRRHWDGTGGCGAAAEHFKATGSKKHLAHFGIDIMKQTKYDKSVEEMEIAANKDFIF